jgi:hypothetical protein
MRGRDGGVRGGEPIANQGRIPVYLEVSVAGLAGILPGQKEGFSA